MPQIEDLIAEETRKIVDVGTDVAEFDGFDDALDALEDEMRRAFEDMLGDLGEVPAHCNHAIDVLEGFVVTTMRQIIEEYVDIDGVLDNLPKQRKRAIEQMERIISDYSHDSNAVISVILGDLDWRYPDLRRVKELLDNPSVDTQEPPGFPGFYKWNEEGTTLEKRNVSRRVWRELVRHELEEGQRNDGLPQNRELRKRIYQAYTDDMFDAAEAANSARAHEFHSLKVNYTRAMELIELKFREEFAKKLIERADNHPLLSERSQRKQRAEERDVRKHRRVESAPGLGNLLFLWLVASLVIPDPVLSSFGIDKGFVFVVIALVFSSTIFLPVLLFHKLLKKYQLRKFDRLQTDDTEDTDDYENEQKSLADLIAEECDLASPEWVEEAAIKKAKEDLEKAERERKAAGMKEPSFTELYAKERVKSAYSDARAKRRARKAKTEQSKLDAEEARQEHRNAAAPGLVAITSLTRIKEFAFVLLLGYMITLWLDRHGIGILLISCLVVLFFIGLLSNLVRRYQLWRFDRDHPSPIEDTV